jgi:hypothetical protein
MHAHTRVRAHAQTYTAEATTHRLPVCVATTTFHHALILLKWLLCFAVGHPLLAVLYSLCPSSRKDSVNFTAWHLQTTYSTARTT